MNFTEASMAIAVYPRGLIYVFSIAMIARSFDLASITFVFFAFAKSLDFGTIVIGYLAGIFFWNISPVPQGIGLVEAAIAITYKYLGLPGGTALAIALVYRLISFWLPMFCGWFLQLKEERTGYKTRTLMGIMGIRLASFFTGLIGDH